MELGSMIKVRLNTTRQRQSCAAPREDDERRRLLSPRPLAGEGWAGGLLLCVQAVECPLPALPRKRRKSKTEVSFLALSVRHDGGIEIGAFCQRVGQDCVLQIGPFKAGAAQIGAVQIGTEQVDPGEGRAT